MGRRPPCPRYCECPCHDGEGANHDPTICPPEGSAKWRFMQANPQHRKFSLKGELHNIRKAVEALRPGEAANVSQTAFLHDAVNRLLDGITDVLKLPTVDPDSLDRVIAPQMWRSRDVKKTLENALREKE